MQKTTSQIAWLLQLAAPELAENPLDATNPRIRLGKPISSKRVRAYKALVVLFACSLSLPFIYALWSGKLSTLEIAVWSLGAIMAFVLIRYLYRTSAFWIVRDGTIRFERLSLKGTIETDTVGGDDVERIDIESGGRRAATTSSRSGSAPGGKSSVRCWSARSRPEPCGRRSPGDWH